MDSATLIIDQQEIDNNISNDYKKKNGIFFTYNINIIDNILSFINFNDVNIINKKVLDPSCGTGIFLIRYIEKVLDVHKLDYNSAISFIQGCIFFVDIETSMVSFTEKNIRLFIKKKFNNEYNGDINGIASDFTILHEEQNCLFKDFDKKYKLSHLLKNIDYVIGNPPYVSLYGRRDQKKSEQQRVYYLNNYSQFPSNIKNGKINLVMLFIEHSIKLLKDGGYLSFIIDVAFFETAYEYTRKFLLDNTRIIRIVTNISDFNVASGQIILTVQKSKCLENSTTVIDYKSNEYIYINQKKWNNLNDQYKFRFNISSINNNLIKKIDTCNYPSLKQLYPNKNLRTCTMLLNMEDKFISKENITIDNMKSYPYYQGSKSFSRKFDEPKFTKYFVYNKKLQDEINDILKEELTLKGIKNKKRIGLGEQLIYDNPKIYIRQSAKEIIATFDNSPSTANNSLYVFSLRDNSVKSVNYLKFLCGYFNSKLVTFYAQQTNIIRFSQGKQPQIKVSDFYKIPVIIDNSIISIIAILVDKIYKNIDKEQSINNIDNIIYKAFNINNEEITIIEKAISTF